MALYTRYVLRVDSATGDDTRGSGSSASAKDNDSISPGVTLDITNNANGSTCVKSDATAFAGPPIVGDTIIDHTNTRLFHIQAVSADNKTLTVCETPATAVPGPATWGIGGYFDTIGRAASVVAPTNPNGTGAGADDHVYVKASADYTGTAKITFSKASARSRMLVFEGYTTTVGDGGRATYDITATAVAGFEPNANDLMFRNFKLTNSGNVTSWIGIDSLSGRFSAENIWFTSSGAGNAGSTHDHTGNAFRCRASCTASGALGISANVFSVMIAFCIVHDCGSRGIRVSPQAVFCIVDTCGTGTVGGGFDDSVATNPTRVLFCTSYNYGTGGDGFRFTDSANNTSNAVIGSIFANNAGLGINRVGITVAVPLHFEFANDIFGNGTPRANAEDTTGYDTAPTDLALDPQFTDAPGQNFAIGTNLKAGALQVFQVGGTSYLDMGAVQRQEPAGGGPAARNIFVPGAIA